LIVDRFATLLAALLVTLPLSAQSSGARVRETEEIGGPMPFDIPSMTMKGVVRAAVDHRLYIVSVSLGEEPIETEVRKFALVTDTGVFEPIGAGGGANLIVPLDRVPVDQEVGQILPSNAIVSLTRRGNAAVTIEAGARETIALLYEVPSVASVRALRLPEGRELPISR
jgi:hypothetical protein